MGFISDSKYFASRTNLTVICKCGCRMPLAHNRKIVTCRWCGGTVYRDKKDEFKAKLKSQIIKAK